MIQQPLPPKEVPPTEEKLLFMLQNGPELVDVVISLINKFKLPFTVKINPETKCGSLEPTLSDGEMWLQRFISVDSDTIVMKDYARKMAKSRYEVLITGETGTGKELIAKSMIADREGKVLGINCAGFPETLIESELFGHVKGSFTGAMTDKRGLMAAATKGVFFLDEIGEMPMPLQAKLLRALQERRIRKVGALEDEEITCKFVCATNRNLKEMVDKGTFRKDLYARISTLELDIKPLRERKCDLVPITESLENGLKFLEKYKDALLSDRLDISCNVRSLQQHVTRFTVLGKVILK